MNDAIYTSGIYKYMNTQMYGGVQKPESKNEHKASTKIISQSECFYIFYSCGKYNT